MLYDCFAVLVRLFRGNNRNHTTAIRAADMIFQLCLAQFSKLFAYGLRTPSHSFIEVLNSTVTKLTAAQF